MRFIGQGFLSKKKKRRLWGLMKLEKLKQRIMEESSIMSENVLNLDGILNHQVDPELTMEMGREFAKRFEGAGVTRVITVESSGIAVGFATALELGVPLVFARRKKNAAG